MGLVKETLEAIPFEDPTPGEKTMTSLWLSIRVSTENI